MDDEYIFGVAILAQAPLWECRFFIVFLWKPHVLPLSMQLLGEEYRDYCMWRAAQLSRQAALMDGEGWRRTAQECGRTPAIWEYTEYKLVDVLEHKKRLGHAFW